MLITALTMTIMLEDKKVFTPLYHKYTLAIKKLKKKKRTSEKLRKQGKEETKIRERRIKRKKCVSAKK